MALRRYQSVTKGLVLAGRAVLSTTNGLPAFYEESTLGFVAQPASRQAARASKPEKCPNEPAEANSFMPDIIAKRTARGTPEWKKHNAAEPAQARFGRLNQ